MEPDQKYAAVGLFVVLSALGLVGFMLWLNGHLARQDKACYLMQFDNSVAGLTQGSAITFRGVGVGQVTVIRINPTNDAQILVRAMLDEKTPITAHTVAQLKPQGITGASYIELDVRPEITDSNRPGPEKECRIIATLPSGIDQIVNTLPQILERALEVTDRLATLLGSDNMTNFGGALANLNELSKQLNMQTEMVGPELQGAAQELKQAMANLNATTASLQDTTEGNVQGLQSAIRQTSAAMAEIRALAGDLRENPRRLILTPKVKEERVP